MNLVERQVGDQPLQLGVFIAQLLQLASANKAGLPPSDRLNEARAEAEVGNVSAARRLALQATPAYIRGLAYLQIHEGRLAAAEFKKLLAHPGLVGTAVTGVLSHLQLARAFRMMGDEAAARTSYEDFLTRWKDADAETPVYQQAKAEYVELTKTH